MIKKTCNSGVAACIWQRDNRPNLVPSGALISKAYVGWIKEILELNYRSHYCIVLVCS
jgi:hypothetical protein